AAEGGSSVITQNPQDLFSPNFTFFDFSRFANKNSCLRCVLDKKITRPQVSLGSNYRQCG
ncbi:hypothetical protein, partial [Planktotalea frisia]|uniref:hypothetical protein n=1 Tax=Planktotalea frisia TaxID=696762 RepID=UPI001C319094